MTPRTPSLMKVLLAATALAMAGTWLVSAAPGDPLPGAPAKAITPPPLPGGPAPDLTIVFTDQVVGYVEPCG